MRVLITSIPVRSGVFTHTRDLAKALSQEGVEVTLGLLASSRVLGKMGIKKGDIPFFTRDFSPCPVFVFETCEQLYFFCRRKQVQLIHAQSTLTFEYSLKVSEKRGIPLVVTLHSVANWQALYPAVLQHAGAIIAVGPETAKSAGTALNAKVHTILNGVDTERYRPAENGPRAFPPLKIAWFGRTDGPAASGLGELDLAVGALKKKNMPIKACVIGHAAGTTAKNMSLLGWIRDPVTHLQNTTVVFGRGRALREAMSCGCIGFLLGEGYGGMVRGNWFNDEKKPALLSASPQHGYPPATSAAIFRDLENLCQQHKTIAALSREARQTALHHFGSEIMAKKTMAVYESLV